MSGLGLYPDHPCYDPNRSSVFPYWLDTWNESYCAFERNFLGMDSRMNFAAPQPGYSPAVPTGALEEPYFITDEEVNAAQAAKAQQWRQTAIPSPGNEIPFGVWLLGAVAIGWVLWPRSSGKTRRRR